MVVAVNVMMMMMMKMMMKMMMIKVAFTNCITATCLNCDLVIISLIMVVLLGSATMAL